MARHDTAVWTAPATPPAQLARWVDDVVQLTCPDAVHWCDGSQAEHDALVASMQADGTLLALNPDTHPDCWLHRSRPDDVARVEHLTFVCTASRDDAGPNNNWMAPDQAHAQMDALFAGCMRGRTLYVVPYCMGPVDSPYARCGVELTDSPYVVASMRIMTRMGTPALQRIARDGRFVKGLHSIGELDPQRRFIMHFPEEDLIRSFGSGYGGNALLGKKCHALRIASWQARQEGWLAEHMLILGIETPGGETHYIAAAFPSACGKTNLAMLIPPEAYREAGWKIWTVGDDIAWLHRGDDGRLWAINPEAGFFGVAPGTGKRTNPNALDMLHHDAIFTNVALTHDDQPWWEGLDQRTPALDWQGRRYDPANGPAAHPNARFTVRASQAASYSPKADDPQGVPLSAIVFGGRRSSGVPLVYEARDWRHGVQIGASMASETTAAAAGRTGVLRRDPMAMQPFCGYHFGDYFAHWLGFDTEGARLPRIFHVNWFGKDADGRFLWPGYGENIRILEWMLKRVNDQVDAVATPAGWMPRRGDINDDGLKLDDAQWRQLLHVDAAAWQREQAECNAWFDSLGERFPDTLRHATDPA